MGMRDERGALDRLASSRISHRARGRVAVTARNRTRPAGAECARALQWREQFPFGDDQLFAQRLAACDITEAEFLGVLDDVGSMPRSGAPPPAWAQTLVDVYVSLEFSASSLRGFASVTDPLFPFLRCAAPLIDHFTSLLREKAIVVADDDPRVPFDAQTVHQLFLDELLGAFKRMLAPTLLLELNLSRLGGQLAGTSSSERFHSFFNRLDNRAAALQLFARYPVLARQLVVRGEQWVASSLAFLRDLLIDWPAIRAGWTLVWRWAG